MIEKGLMPPPVFPDEALTPEKVLRRGTVLLCLGIGLGLAAVIAAYRVEQELGGILAVTAAIVGFIGLGNLVYYFINRRRLPAEDRDTPQAT
jgi:hypothetical protein